MLFRIGKVSINVTDTLRDYVSLLKTVEFEELHSSSETALKIVYWVKNQP